MAGLQLLASREVLRPVPPAGAVELTTAALLQGLGMRLRALYARADEATSS